MRPTPTEFIRWLFLDEASRQDVSGKGVPRGHRRYKYRRPIVIHSRKVLDLNAASDIWGICYQLGDRRVRGGDLLYRLTLAAMAIQEAEGIGLPTACTELVNNESVIRSCGFKGTAGEVDSLRVRITRYRKRCRNNGIDLRSDLGMMQEYWRYVHLDEMWASEWHNNLLGEFRARIVKVDEEIQKCSEPSERELLQRLRLGQYGTLASELHDSGRFEEAREYYEVVIGGLQDSNDDLNSSVILDWYMEQSERCKRKEPREQTPVLMDGLVTRIG